MKVTRFQAGGEMPAGAQGGPEGGAPQGGNPMDQIIPAMAQAVQAGDCQTLMQVCSQFLQVVGAASEQQPQPTYARKGGRLVRI